MKDYLEQEVTELGAELHGIAPIDRLGDLVRLLDHVRPDGLVGLLAIPWAATLAAQLRHDLRQAIEFLHRVLSRTVAAWKRAYYLICMAEVTVYTTSYCPFCTRAKTLLRQKGIAFREIDVSGDPAQRASLVERTGGRRTVPQIFIDGEPIGGYEELAALDRAGRLDPLLGQE